MINSRCIKMSKEDILKSFKVKLRTKVSDYNLDEIKPIKHLIPDDGRSEDDIVFGYLEGFEFGYLNLNVYTNNYSYDWSISYLKGRKEYTLKVSNNTIFTTVKYKYGTTGVTSILVQLSDGSWIKKNLTYSKSHYDSCLCEDGTNLLLDVYGYRASTKSDYDIIDELENTSIKAIVPIFDINDLAYDYVKSESEYLNVLSNKLELLHSGFELEAGKSYNIIGYDNDDLVMQPTFHPDPGFDFMADTIEDRYFFSKNGICVAYGERHLDGHNYTVSYNHNIVHPNYKRNTELEIKNG